MQLWNKNHFGNVFGKKRRFLARLNGIQNAMSERPSTSLIKLERSLLKILDIILD